MFFDSFVLVLLVFRRLNRKVERLARDLLVDGEHVPRARLEVTRRIVTLCNVERFGPRIVYRLVQVTHTDEHLEEGAEQFEGRLDLRLWLLRLHSGRNDRDTEALCANGMRRRNHRNVDVYQAHNKPMK